MPNLCIVEWSLSSEPLNNKQDHKIMNLKACVAVCISEDLQRSVCRQTIEESKHEYITNHNIIESNSRFHKFDLSNLIIITSPVMSLSLSILQSTPAYLSVSQFILALFCNFRSC